MRVSIKLYKNNISKFGYSVIVYFKSPEICKRLAIGKYLNNNVYYFIHDDWGFANEPLFLQLKNHDLVYPKIKNLRK
ncbi:MAG: hypothetical protein JKY73_04595 [Lutibacter sp.]|nr:hypothetical protein [Lutibacter sp.]